MPAKPFSRRFSKNDSKSFLQGGLPIVIFASITKFFQLLAYLENVSSMNNLANLSTSKGFMSSILRRVGGVIRVFIYNGSIKCDDLRESRNLFQA